jgi:hypothetical protein
VLTSSIYPRIKFLGLVFFGGAHRGTVCVRCIHMCECMYVFKSLHLYCLSQKIKMADEHTKLVISDLLQSISNGKITR